MSTRTICLLGSTGSIGTQAVDVISRYPDRFTVTAISAGGGHAELLADQVKQTGASRVAIADESKEAELAAALGQRGCHPEIICGPNAASELARSGADVVLNGITGAAGLLPTLSALESGTTLALANKESLVIGGELVTRAAAPGQIVAVDSEHSAFAQALRAGRKSEVKRLLLTASGGPFRGKTRDELAAMTVDQALAHPTWSMGRVITINSSTLVNKGLELLEAALLYDVDLDDVTVVVHPQSIVHSMVEFHDGATIAQCSPPDMRLPIALGLTWPERLEGAITPLDWSQASSWTFEPLDNQAFPAVELARRCGKLGGTAPAVFNAANEVCVDAFCARRLGFLEIADTIEAVVNDHVSGMGDGLVRGASLDVETLLAADAWARARATERIA